jgi:hypothetical protein
VVKRHDPFGAAKNLARAMTLVTFNPAEKQLCFAREFILCFDTFSRLRL